MAGVTSGMLHGRIPYLAVGRDGPPLVVAMGLTPTHEVPTGWERRMALRSVAPLSAHFRVYVVNREPGLRPGASMSDIAGSLAEAVRREFGEPVLLTGTSTGGSVALQLAVDHPELVRALVVVASASTLGPRGRHLQRELARLTRAGDATTGWAELLAAMLPRPLQRPARPLVRRVAASMAPEDASDLLVTLDAEDAFDVGDRLHRITAPTLVIGGGRDAFYPRERFERTAAGVQDGRAHVVPTWGHVRTSGSSATANITLGFLLAAVRDTSAAP
jgi:pimeloyl-ACP methyl ester carboxylesterase